MWSNILRTDVTIMKIISSQWSIIILFLFTLFINPCRAQVTVDVRIDSLELFVGEQTGITLEVSGEKGTTLILPRYEEGDTLVSGVEVVEMAKADTQMLNEGARQLITQRYVVTSFDSALYYIPPFVVQANGERYESNSLALRVLTIPVDTIHLDQFFPPKGIMDLKFAWADWRLIVWLTALLLLWIAGWVWLFVRYKSNKPIIKFVKRAPKLPPHAAAMEEIERIKAEKVWAQENSKEYYTRLTAILRTYIERRYGFNAMEMTSTEIIEHLMHEQTKESLEELRTLFETADLAKFAKFNTPANENDRNLVSAVEFINQTKIEVDPSKAEPDQEIIEQHRSRRILISMRATLIGLAVAGVALLSWIVWMVWNVLN